MLWLVFKLNLKCVSLENKRIFRPEYKVPANTTRTIHNNLNTNDATKVKAGDQLTDNIPTPGGVRKGDSLSPFLFNLLMDRIMKKETFLNLGYGMGNKKIGMVCYADDAAIIANQKTTYRDSSSSSFKQATNSI